MPIILIMNKKRIYSFQDFQDNFNAQEAVSYLKNGRLEKWMSGINCNEIYEEIKRIDLNISDEELLNKLLNICNIQDEQKAVLLSEFTPKQAEIISEIKEDECEGEDFSYFPQEIPDDFEGIKLSSTCFLKMVKIPAGSFMMGPPVTRGNLGWKYDSNEKYKITFSEDFYCSKCTISIRQWNLVNGDEENKKREVLPSSSLLAFVTDEFWDELDDSIRQLTWYEANDFCSKLNEQKSEWGIPDNYFFSLPTECEWEYIARAGNDSDDELNLACLDHSFCDYAGEETNVFGQHGIKNKFGLADIGLDGEWCSTPYSFYPESDMNDPVAPENSTENKVCRSEPAAGWFKFAGRWEIAPDDISEFRSFRIILKKKHE